MKKLKSIVEIMTEFPESYFDKYGNFNIPITKVTTFSIRAEDLCILNTNVDETRSYYDFPDCLFKKPEPRIKAYAYVDVHGEIRKFTAPNDYMADERAPDFDEYWDEDERE